MKLSEVKGERALDVIAEIIPPICNLASDENVKQLFSNNATLPEGMSADQFTLERIKNGLPAMMKTHKADFIHILASIEGVTDDEYAASMSIVTLIKDALDLVVDPDFRALFS